MLHQPLKGLCGSGTLCRNRGFSFKVASETIGSHGCIKRILYIAIIVFMNFSGLKEDNSFLKTSGNSSQA